MDNQNNNQIPNQNPQQVPNNNQQSNSMANQGGITCPNCGSTNVNVQFVQDNMRTSTKGNGCLWSIGRICLICCTCGLWLLVGKHKATSKTAVNNRKVHVCQNCGYNW